MKKILTTLSVLTIGTITGNLSNFFNTNIKKHDILNNENEQKTQQNTIYIDENGKRVTTNEHNLSLIRTQEIIQIGFYQIEEGKIQVVTMPKYVEKVPDQLPSEITSLEGMFAGNRHFNGNISKWNTSNVINMSGLFTSAWAFNQDLSKWNTSNVTNMDYMFGNARSFNQDLSSWNVDKVTTHINFSGSSGIDNPNKLPKFKN